MGRAAYSIDLRERVVAEIAGGASRREAAKRFKVSESSSIRWAKLQERSGSVRPKPRGGRSRSPLTPHTQWLLDLIAGEPDLSLDEIVVRIGGSLGVTTSRSSLDRFYRRHRISFKKNGARRGTRAGGCEGGPASLAGRPAQA
jgi:transposase